MRAPRASRNSVLPGLRGAGSQPRCAVPAVDSAVASGPRLAAARVRALGLLVCAPPSAARATRPAAVASATGPAAVASATGPAAVASATGRAAAAARLPDATRPDGLVPSGDPPTAMLGDLRLAPASGGPRRPGRPLVPVILAAALVAVVAGVVIFRALSGSTAAAGTSGTTPSASSQDARRQVAVRLSGLLAQSVTDRAAVIGAAEDVRGCGPSLPQDARTFARSASSRQHLLSLLASLPGRPLLPAAMLQDLTSAWQASDQVDTDLARWTQDNIARGCHGNSRSDASLRASYIPEDQAAVGKQAFATLWDPIAAQYGLTTYQRNQL